MTKERNEAQKAYLNQIHNSELLPKVMAPFYAPFAGAFGWFSSRLSAGYEKYLLENPPLEGFDGMLTTGLIEASYAVTVFCAYKAIDPFVFTGIEKAKAAYARKFPEKRPFENIDDIRVEDSEGLEMLMEKTSEKLDYEWCTFMYADRVDDTAVIKKIETADEARKKGVKSYSFKTRIFCPNFGKARREYQGEHHYHPDIFEQSSRNYHINLADRTTSKVNLLTFMHNEEPEVIGFNARDVFLPTDASKSHLVKASRQDVLEYLQ